VGAPRARPARVIRAEAVEHGAPAALIASGTSPSLSASVSGAAFTIDAKRQLSLQIDARPARAYLSTCPRIAPPRVARKKTSAEALVASVGSSVEGAGDRPRRHYCYQRSLEQHRLIRATDTLVGSLALYDVGSGKHDLDARVAALRRADRLLAWMRPAPPPGSHQQRIVTITISMTR
jgi:hypothetical protein